MLRIENEMTFVHGTVKNPEKFFYLLDPDEAAESFAVMETAVGFVGHTHVPSSFEKGEDHVVQLLAGIFKLKKNQSYFLNPGSVGQPRDRDHRLSYGIFDAEKQSFEIFRLEYDNEKAASKIVRAGLPKYLAERLL